MGRGKQRCCKEAVSREGWGIGGLFKISTGGKLGV